ncbi:MAG: NAD(+)/NADH kinase [Gaiellales bacterium]
MSSQQSKTPSARTDPPRRVERVSVLMHGRPQRVGEARGRLAAVAERCGVAVVDRHEQSDLLVVLGGDGTMLRALHLVLDQQTPCLGVNFGRVGFLTAIEGADLESGLERAFAGDFTVVDIPTIEADDGVSRVIGINDVVLTSSLLGRMALVEWSVDDESLGVLGCDGVIVATSTGSTAYNLSAGGPALAWGLDGFVVSFVSPHSLHVRPMVLGRPHVLELANRSDDVPVQVIVDGHIHGRLDPGGRLSLHLGERSARLARLSGSSFFSRYRETFSH